MTASFRLFVFLSWVSISMTACLSTGSEAIDTEADIQKAHQLVIGSFDDIWAGLDTSKLLIYHTPDFILLEQGTVWNNDSIRNYQLREAPNAAREQYQRLNHIEFIRTEHRGSSVWMAYDNFGTWVQEGDTIGTAHWLESAVAIPTDNGWRLEMLHSTRVRK
jgi:hypothetical protein